MERVATASKKQSPAALLSACPKAMDAVGSRPLSSRKRRAAGDHAAPAMSVLKPAVVQTMLDRDVKLCFPSASAEQRITPKDKLRKRKRLPKATGVKATSSRKTSGFGFGSTPRFSWADSSKTPTKSTHPSLRMQPLFQAWKRSRPTAPVGKQVALRRPSTPVKAPPTPAKAASTPVKPPVEEPSVASLPPTTLSETLAPPLSPSIPLVEDAPLQRIVAGLAARQCRLVCLDFDRTLIDIHTNGDWSSSAAHLATHLRPLFVPLLQHLHAHGVFLAVTTFSPQHELIKEMLRLAMGATVADAIVVRADVATWTLDDDVPDVPRHVLADRGHKLPYLVSSAVAVGVPVRDAVLIDDDATNLHRVAEFGVHTVWFEPHESLDSLALKLAPPVVETHVTPVKNRAAVPRCERLGRPVKPKRPRTLVY
ncbi:ATP-binding Cassette (ABC) superfamily [Achlya hypogyna]|uniref:ATP-binding Cassette (ABC) superfamily n=1 Tax=Achlya hypogyna TaxID=1202772 RepID=A0A1V9Z9T5_ACHHY|nr:ATP-binding Cassette (ABC) superfamily [Achlya hypogyna]